MQQFIYIILVAVMLTACQESTVNDVTTTAEKRIILVAGATGQQGGAVARELLARGYPVRGLTRDPDSDRARALAAQGAEMVKGDFNDPDSLLKAMDGAYGAFSVQNFWLVDFDTEVEQGKNFANAAKASGIQHLVYTSVGSADKGTGIPHFESKYLIEQHIKSLDIPYTIIRPVAFIDNWEYARDDILQGKWSTPYSINKRGQWVAVRDIGRFAAEALDDPDSWIGRTLDIASIEHTVEEVMAIFERSTGVGMNYQRIPWDAYEASAGEEMTIMNKWIEGTGYSADVEQLRLDYPWLMTLEEYLMEAGWHNHR